MFRSSQLYKNRKLLAIITLSIIWVEIVFCQQQKKTAPSVWLWPDFLYELFNTIADNMFIGFLLYTNTHSWFGWRREREEKGFEEVNLILKKSQSKQRSWFRSLRRAFETSQVLHWRVAFWLWWAEPFVETETMALCNRLRINRDSGVIALGQQCLLRPTKIQ